MDAHHPIINAYRRYLAWASVSDPFRAIQAMRTTLLNPNENVITRYTALVSMHRLGEKANEAKASYAEAIQRINLRTLAELFASSEMPRSLATMAIKHISANLNQPLTADSDLTLCLHYLLNVIANSPNADFVRDTCASLESILRQNDPKTNAPYYYPEIITILERREAAEKANGVENGNGPDPRRATGVLLGNLHYLKRRHLSDFKDVAPIVRHIPSLGNSELAQRLRTTLKKSSLYGDDKN